MATSDTTLDEKETVQMVSSVNESFKRHLVFNLSSSPLRIVNNIDTIGRNERDHIVIT